MYNVRINEGSLELFQSPLPREYNIELRMLLRARKSGT